MHLDVRVGGRGDDARAKIDAEVARLESDGATQAWVRIEHGRYHVVMRDPEGASSASSEAAAVTPAELASSCFAKSGAWRDYPWGATRGRVACESFAFHGSARIGVGGPTRDDADE